MNSLVEISWKKGTLRVREFYDNNLRPHYCVEGWKRDEEDFPVVPLKERRSCRAFLRGYRLEKHYRNFVPGDARIHFRNEPKRNRLR